MARDDFAWGRWVPLVACPPVRATRPGALVGKPPVAPEEADAAGPGDLRRRSDRFDADDEWRMPGEGRGEALRRVPRQASLPRRSPSAIFHSTFVIRHPSSS